MRVFAANETPKQSLKQELTSPFTELTAPSDRVLVIWPSFCRINLSCNIRLCIVLSRFLCAKRENCQSGRERGRANPTDGKIKVHCALKVFAPPNRNNEKFMEIFASTHKQ